MKKKIVIFLLSLIAVFCFSFAFTACNSTPVPPVNGVDGKDGVDGKGIEDIVINDIGELVITYTDGTEINLGKVTGEDGADGEKGETGATGKEISYIFFNARNELVFKFNNNTTLNLGKIEGTGRDGRGILDVAFNIDKELIVTYTDGKTTNLGKIAGLNGTDGRGIYSAEFNSDGELIITYTDGKVTNLGKIAIEGGVCEHEFTVWNQMLVPSCSSIGYNTRTCTKCSITDYEILPSIGHDFGDRIEIKEKTCTKDGLTLYVCKTCGTAKAEEAFHEGHKFSGNVCTVCNAQLTDSEGLSFELNEDGKSYSVTGLGANKDNAIKIPASFNGLPVTEIADGAFSNSDIEKFYFPDTVTSIGDHAFSCCDKITEIEIPASVTEIKRLAFMSCANLSAITLNDGLKTIGDNAFYSCAYTKITIPRTVVYIGQYAFSALRSTLKTAVFEVKSGWTRTAYNNDKVVDTSVISENNLSNTSTAARLLDGEYYSATAGRAFGYIWTRANSLSFELNEDGKSYSVKGIGTLTDSDVIIPSSYEGLPVTSIAERAFDNCKNIENVLIPDSVMEIGGYAFRGCYDLKSVDIRGNLTEIKLRTFLMCRNLTKVTLPDSITTIGTGAFGACRSLSRIKLPEQLNTIQILAFVQCDSLTEITLPYELQTIEERAFQFCSALTSVKFENATGWVRTASYNNEVVYTEALKEEALTDTAKVRELLDETYAYELLDGNTRTCYYVWTRTETE